MRTAAEFIARAAGTLSRRFGRGGGTTLPGFVLLRLRPNGTAELASELGHGSIAISATNGKTTTARMISAGLDAAHRPIVSNRAGANLLSGVTSALLATSVEQRREAIGLFEVDEAALPLVAQRAELSVIALINLFRDQLDRYGELETLLDTWRDMISKLDPKRTTLVVNADDPALSSLGHEYEQRSGPVVWFGVDDVSGALSEMEHAADSTTCRSCGKPLVYSAITLGHLGHWSCPTGDTTRPDPAVAVVAISQSDAHGQHVEIRTPAGPVEAKMSLPGVHNAYNAAAATATLIALSVAPDTIAKGLSTTEAAFGRAERVEVDGRDVMLMLAKNPTGVNANIRTVLGTGSDTTPLHVLAMLNDRTADGQDVSWIWDVDYEPLLPRLVDLTVAGDRCRDLGLRFRYGGIDEALMHVVPEAAAAFDAALAATPVGGVLYVLPTYTAMLDLRHVLTERGLTTAFWEAE